MKSLFKYILSISLLLATGNVYGAECEIPICVIVDKGFANLTPETASVMETQLQRLASQSNLNIGWQNARFVLTAKLDQIDRYIVDGAPSQIVNVFGVTLYIADIYNQKLCTSTYTEIKGIGTNDTKASLNAVKPLGISGLYKNKRVADAKRTRENTWRYVICRPMSTYSFKK